MVYQQQTKPSTKKVCCGQIAFLLGQDDNRGMVKRPRNVPKAPNRTKARRRRALPRKPLPQLFLSEWLARLKKKQQEIAKAAGIGKSYMSQIVSLQKDDPSAAIVFWISEALGVTVNDLYRPPPTRAEIDKLREYRRATIESLINPGS